ncbi:hypothetical protein [Granulicella sp. L46]|jgi:hypothetical protein|uniref:hypothetical protein n=1 Tax=Granulicella sp. L46 TaxID=1641865 RepID=UPI00131C52CB|nr:hypothetical protein [Granulicella sp. L46]
MGVAVLHYVFRRCTIAFMLTADQIRLLPNRRFAFEAASGREIKGTYEPTERQPETLWLSTIAKLSNGSPFLVVRSYLVSSKLSVEELAAKGEDLDAEAQAKELV